MHLFFISLFIAGYGSKDKNNFYVSIHASHFLCNRKSEIFYKKLLHNKTTGAFKLCVDCTDSFFSESFLQISF